MRGRWWCVALFFAGALASGDGSAAAEFPAPSDDLSFRRLAIPDGVPAQVVTALAQDPAGFLWIGTQQGLVRYDGYEFRVFPPGDSPTGLSGAYVRSLLVARDGRVWAGTFSGGLSVFDPRQETFRHFRHDPLDPASLANDRVEGLAEDASGAIWVATSEGLDLLDPATGRCRHFLVGERSRGLLLDRAGRLWVGGRGALWRHSGDEFVRVHAGDAWLGRQNVTRIVEDDRGRIFFGTAEEGAGIHDPASGRLVVLPPALPGQPPRPDQLSNTWVYALAQVGAREMWLATFGGGIDVVDLDTLQVVARLRHDPRFAASLGGDRLGALAVDAAGVVWVGAWGQGLARHDPAARAWRVPRALSHPAVVRALARPDGTLWAGTNGNGIDVLDAALRPVGAYRPAADDSQALANGAITCFAQSRDGTAWVATIDGTLHRQAGDGFERFGRAEGLAGGQIRALLFEPSPAGEPESVLWAASSAGLTRIDLRAPRAKGGMTVFGHRREDPATLSGVAIESLAIDGEGRFWVGTDNGLNLFDRATGIATRVPPGGLPNAWIRDLLVDSGGRLWVATEGGAAVLSAWEGGQPRFEPIAARIGRPPAPVESLVEDAEGWIWLGPTLRVDPRTWGSKAFGAADGCELNSFFIASRERLADGRLAFGSPNGLQVVDPARLKDWTFQPPLAIAGLRVEGQPLPGVVERLLLKPGQRGFALDVAALDFSAPERLRYRHRLEGYDRDWQLRDAAHRSLAYTNLAPGAYTLRVEGSNRVGEYSPQGLALPIEVQPSFYQRKAFKTLAGLLVLASAFGLYRWRVVALEKRGRLLEALVRDRTQSLEARGVELERAYRSLEEASLRDPLTGLRNRRFLDTALPPDLDLILRRHRDGQETASTHLAFLLLDLDHFKSVNDTYGHAAGDAVLVQAAQRLQAQVRGADYVVRWGGEEFLVVARFVAAGEAAALAENLRRAIGVEPMELPDGRPLARTVSIGGALFPFRDDAPGAFGWEKVVHLADLALYAAKKGGRDRWHLIEAHADLQPDDDLDAALEDGRLMLRES